MVKGVWDFKAWMEPFLGALKYHSKYLCFRFTMNDDPPKMVAPVNIIISGVNIFRDSTQRSLGRSRPRIEANHGEALTVLWINEPQSLGR